MGCLASAAIIGAVRSEYICLKCDHSFAIEITDSEAASALSPERSQHERPAAAGAPAVGRLPGPDAARKLT